MAYSANSETIIFKSQLMTKNVHVHVHVHTPPPSPWEGIDYHNIVFIIEFI